MARIVEFIENRTNRRPRLRPDGGGRYVLSADIWAELERTEPGAWGRIQLTDAIAELAKKQSVDAMLMTGESYDCGKKMGYMQAFVTYGMRNLKEGAKFRESIKTAGLSASLKPSGKAEAFVLPLKTLCRNYS